MYNENNGVFNKSGDNIFNITVYKDNGVVYIKKQTGTFEPTWWGGNLPPTILSPISGNDNKANIDLEKIWGERESNHIKLSEKLFINRLNGEIRVDSHHRDNEKSTRYIEKGSCRKINNLF